MDLTSIILLLIALLSWLSGFYFMYKIPLCKDYENKSYPNVSIIIPARNEEHNIGILLDSINNQSIKPLEIIVVNDSSTDKTKEIALEKGAKVIDNNTLPSGWLGKPWACFQGAKNAIGDVFIFLDSDITIEDGGLKKIIGTYLKKSNNNRNIAMSIAPYHKVNEIYEEMSAIFNLIMVGSMNAFTPNSKAIPAGLFGPSLIVSKENYYKIQGHESVKDQILENMFMAEKFQKENIDLVCLGGMGTLTYRMYQNGLKDLTLGWQKAFATGAVQIPLQSLLNIITWISGGFIISILLVKSFIDLQNLYLWFALYVVFALQVLWMLRRIGSFRLISSILFPIHLVYFCIVFSKSTFNKVFNKKTNWKSREV